MLGSHKRLFSERMPRMKRVAAATLAVLALASGTLSGVIFPNPAAFFFTAVALSLTATLIFTYRSPYLYVIPILSFAISAVITGSFVSAAFAAVFAPAAVVLALALYEKASKARAIAFTSAALGAAVVVSGLLAFATDSSSFPTVESVREAMEAYFSSLSFNTADGRAAIFTEQAATGLASYFTLSLPAIFIILINTVSFVSVSLFAALIRLFMFADRIPDGKWVYTPETASAVLFLLSYATSSALISFSSADVIGYAAENLLIALTPAMMIAGCRISYKLSEKHGKKVILVIATVILLLFSPSLYLMIISFWGALHLIYKSLLPYWRRLFPSGTDGDDGDT